MIYQQSHIYVKTQDTILQKMSGDIFVTVDSDTEAKNTQEARNTHYLYSMIAIGTVLILLLAGTKRLACLALRP
ncbi:hypothetical protein MT325_m123L [Paramecium bursaria chlorella virus MT325]|uniref:Uncharacterized protein m123L n=1 Tax=Paramecium bursaria Chlorella virus MT325 TaxID=346932 RepID=A7ITK3_PBCVM|nr:hypothetical protein MT325_m123L [Paramecium bursaria chlorella virus MT325]